MICPNCWKEITEKYFVMTPSELADLLMKVYEGGKKAGVTK